MATIENCIGYSRVFLGIAEPLRVKGSQGTDNQFYAPLATYESTIVASCFRGCKAFNLCGGVQFTALEKEMSHTPVFSFPSTKEAVAFVKHLPDLRSQFIEDAESTS